MKKILALLFVLSLVCGVHAQNVVTATLTITNAPTTNGETIVVNGATRFWTNVVANPATQIATNATIGGSATNLFLAYSVAPAAGLYLSMPATNQIVFQSYPGIALTVTTTNTTGSNWASVTFSTNTLTPAQIVRVPFGVEGTYGNSNTETGIVGYLNDTAGSGAVATNSQYLTNYISLNSGTQTIQGNKTWTGTQTYTGNLLSGTTNIQTALAGKAPIVAPSFTGNMTVSGSITSGGAISFDGTDITSDGSGNLTLNSVTANGQTITGSGSMITAGLGDTRYVLGVNGTAVNLSMAGTNSIGGRVIYPRFNNAALANGVNAGVSVGTNVYVMFSGPTTNATIAGLAGGVDGRFVIAQYSPPTGSSLTIANDSGGDGTAANRIYTGTGADIAFTANPTTLFFIYNGNTAHWTLFTPATATVSSAVSALTGTFGTLAVTNELAPTNIPYRSGVFTIGNLSTSQAVTFATPFQPSVGTNYSVSINFDTAIAAAVGASTGSKTTNGFTLNLAAGIAGTTTADYIATPYR